MCPGARAAAAAAACHCWLCGPSSACPVMAQSWAVSGGFRHSAGRAGLSWVDPSALCMELGCLGWILALHVQSWAVSGGFQCSTRRAGLSRVDPSASSPLTEGCSLAIAKRDAKLLASSALLPLSPPQL